MRATDSPRAKIILYFIPRIHTEKYMNYAPPTLSRVLETGAPDSPARTERDCARGRTVTEDTRTCDRSDTTAAVRPQPPRTSAAMRCARSALRITILTTSQRARRSRAPAGAPVTDDRSDLQPGLYALRGVGMYRRRAAFSLRLSLAQLRELWPCCEYRPAHSPHACFPPIRAFLRTTLLKHHECSRSTRPSSRVPHSIVKMLRPTISWNAS